jgi:hypothetical protein
MDAPLRLGGAGLQGKLMKLAARLTALALPILCSVGCSMMDPNPISPQKMLEIRKKESADRAHFNPTMSAPPGNAGH